MNWEREGWERKQSTSALCTTTAILTLASSSSHETAVVQVCTPGPMPT